MTKDEIIDEVEEAFSFYADPDSHFATSFLNGPPCEEFMGDFNKEHGFTNYINPMPGKRDKQVLKKIEDR